MLARGNVAYDAGRIGEAVTAYGTAVTLVEELLSAYDLRGAPEHLLRVALRLNHSLGAVMSEQGDRRTAVLRFGRALELATALDPESQETGVRHHNLATVYDELGDAAEATRHYEAALQIFHVCAPGSRVQANTLGSVGRLLLETGRRDEGIEYLDAFVELASVAYPAAGEAVANLTHIGGILKFHGELDRAFACLSKAAELAATADSLSTARADALNTMGIIAFEQGRVEDARRLFERALTLYEAIDPASVHAAGVQNNLGLVAKTQGNLVRALLHYRSALAVAETDLSGSVEHATALNNIGAVLRAAGELAEARQYYDRSVAITRAASPSSQALAGALNNLGFVDLAAGDLDSALERFTEALGILDSVAPHSKETARCLQNIGAVHEERGVLNEALGHYERALEIDSAVAPGSAEVAYRHARIASVLRAQGKLEAAVPHFEEAVAIAQSLRLQAGQAKEWVLSRHYSAFVGLISCLFERGSPGDHEHAFDISERSRARALVELLSEREIDFGEISEQQKALLEEERMIQARLAATYNRMSRLRQHGGAPEVVSRVAVEVHELEAAVDDLRAEIRDAFPEYADLRYPEPLSLRQVQGQLDPETLLLSYTVAKDETFLFAVRDDDFRMSSSGHSEDRLDEAIESAVGPYRRGSRPDERATAATRELSRFLLGPLGGDLTTGVTRVVILPDGALFYLPFELLPLLDGVLFGERYVTCYAPSATVLASLAPRRTRSGERAFIGFGDADFSASTTGARATGGSAVALPSLPGTRRELERIAGALRPGSAVVHLGADATEHRVKTQTAGYRFVHIATHGLLDDVNPLYSGLALSPPLAGEPADADEFLQTYELPGLPLNGCELAVLSACQTGLGRIRAGEGLVGMTRALLFAGADCVVVSVWPVPDLPTGRLMERFYGFLAEGDGPALALKRAKESVRKSHPAVYRDAASWAAFIPVGLGW